MRAITKDLDFSGLCSLSTDRSNMFNYDHLDAETISAVLENCRGLLCPSPGRPSAAIAIIS
jgi:hypothetical protein